MARGGGRHCLLVLDDISWTLWSSVRAISFGSVTAIFFTAAADGLVGPDSCAGSGNLHACNAEIKTDEVSAALNPFDGYDERSRCHSISSQTCDVYLVVIGFKINAF